MEEIIVTIGLERFSNKAIYNGTMSWILLGYFEIYCLEKSGESLFPQLDL